MFSCISESDELYIMSNGESIIHPTIASEGITSYQKYNLKSISFSTKVKFSRIQKREREGGEEGEKEGRRVKKIEMRRKEGREERRQKQRRKRKQGEKEGRGIQGGNKEGLEV